DLAQGLQPRFRPCLAAVDRVPTGRNRYPHQRWKPPRRRLVIPPTSGPTSPTGSALELPQAATSTVTSRAVVSLVAHRSPVFVVGTSALAVVVVPTSTAPATMTGTARRRRIPRLDLASSPFERVTVWWPGSTPPRELGAVNARVAGAPMGKKSTVD